MVALIVGLIDIALIIGGTFLIFKFFVWLYFIITEPKQQERMQAASERRRNGVDGVLPVAAKVESNWTQHTTYDSHTCPYCTESNKFIPQHYHGHTIPGDQVVPCDRCRSHYYIDGCILPRTDREKAIFNQEQIDRQISASPYYAAHVDAIVNAVSKVISGSNHPRDIVLSIFKDSAQLSYKVDYYGRSGEGNYSNGACRSDYSITDYSPISTEAGVRHLGEVCVKAIESRLNCHAYLSEKDTKRFVEAHREYRIVITIY